MIETRRTSQTSWTDALRHGARIGHVIEAHESLGSTNDRVRALLTRPDGEGIIVIAEEQTRGRGRHGRSWTSPPGRNLMMSVGVRPRLAAENAGMLAIAAALAVHDACGRVAPVELKWPNDVIAPDGRKLGGMLVETVVAGERLESAAIGIGVNVNWRRSEMPSELADQATSLAELVGSEIDRVALLSTIAERLERELTLVESGESSRDRYRAACVTLGSRVLAETPGGPVEGLAADIDERGALVIEADTGTISVTSGEVRDVRPRDRS